MGNDEGQGRMQRLDKMDAGAKSGVRGEGGGSDVPHSVPEHWCCRSSFLVRVTLDGLQLSSQRFLSVLDPFKCGASSEKAARTISKYLI